MAFNINGTTVSGGSSTFAVNGTYGQILSTDSSGNVFNTNWQTNGVLFGNGWYEIDRIWRGNDYAYISRFAKTFTQGASAGAFNIFRFTPSNGWTWAWTGMEVYNFAQNGTGYGRWLFPTTGGTSPGYSPGVNAVQTAQGGYQGSTAPVISSSVNNPPFPDGGYYDAQVQLTVPGYSYVHVIVEVDRNTQTPVTSITGKWQVALQ